MALQLADRVFETGTVSTGTGSVTLGGAVSGYVAFSSTITSGNTTYYCIYDSIAGVWEVGIGTFTTSPNTLARTTVISNSLGTTALISFSTSNSLNVFITQPAENTVVSSNNPGTSGYVLTSNGTGLAPSWQASGGGGGSPGGSNTQVQYNSSGSFAGSANMTFDGTSLTLANDAKIHGMTIGQGGGNSGGTTSTVIGVNAGASFSGGYLVALGWNAGNTVTGTRNVLIGAEAGYKITTGIDNTFVGTFSGSNTTTTTISYSTGIGSYSLSNAKTANYATAVGYQALGVLTTQNYATAIGANAGLNYGATDTYGSFFGGYQSGYYNTTGADNIFIGGNAGYGVSGSTTGGKNVAIGAQAMGVYTTATQNVAIGYQAGSTLTTGSNNILLGYQAAPSAVTVSNEITIGNSSSIVLRYPHNYSTVASLPSASTVGRGSRTFVTDALTPTFQATVTGGGAVFTPVYSDGTNWKVG